MLMHKREESRTPFHSSHHPSREIDKICRLVVVATLVVVLRLLRLVFELGT